MNSFLNINESTSDASAAPASIFSTIPTHKQDVSSIPPAFFVGRSNDTPDVSDSVGHTRKQRNLSIGYGDRRLSGVLSEVKYWYANATRRINAWHTAET